MADTPESTATSIANPFTSGGGQGQDKENISFASFIASLAVALIVFGVELLAFFILKGRFARIYAPKTFLVPKRERITAAPSGLIRWIIPVLKTSNSDFIHKCGLDAYLFLRYLRMLLKIFLPLALVILPILLPLNSVGTHTESTSGMDLFGWQNVSPQHHSRFWAHLLLAILVIIYVCYTFYDELRKYVRLRQAYLTSPQHRLRASATTVLVSNIPHKWLTEEALDGLYDVFPGGVRNIWINRNFDELSEKVAMRDKYAKLLEAAETNLIRECVKKHAKQVEKDLKASGVKKTRAQKKRDREAEDALEQQAAAEDPGVSAGNPHQIPDSIEDAIREGPIEPGEQKSEREHKLKVVPVLGDGLDAVGRGFGAVGRGFGKAGGAVFGGLKRGKGAATDPEDRPIREPEELDDDVYSARQPSSDRPLRSFESADPNDRAGLGYDGIDEVGTGRRVRPSDDTAVDRNVASSERNTTASPNMDEKKPVKRQTTYPAAYDEDFDPMVHADIDADAEWRKYLKPKDRETMRLPLFHKSWWPSLPFIGQKVDKIYYARRRLAQLNAEIEKDQQHPENFPKMSSAFIQFNHQVAAHMACQTVSHHIPKHMAPRVVEIAPKDVIWDNLSVKWWEGMIRTAIVIAALVGIIIAWAVPISFTGLLSQINYLTETFKWLNWLNELPKTAISIIQGILPPLFLAILLALLPVLLRLLARLKGVQTGMQIEQTVQNYYFAFLFIQVFLVVSISSSIGATVEALISDPLSVPQTLANNLPKASNYFFSYMILQALTVSAGALMQIGGLIQFFFLAPILDTTAREKWRRQLQLTQVPWGTFFPVYTNLAAIGIIYSVISPLILVFNIITFSLFWIVYRYQTLYVFRFELDTGGLLFPRAINQLFTGLYVLELCLIGLFFLARTPDGSAACVPQAIIIIVFLVLTVLYQYLLNDAFGPLFRYIPITLEDDAVRRDEEFQRANAMRWELDEAEREGDDIQEVLAQRERDEAQEDRDAEAIELAEIEKRKSTPYRYEDDPLDAPRSPAPPGYDGSDEKQLGGLGSHFKAPLSTVAKPFRPSNWGSAGTRKSWADRSDPHNRRISHHGETAEMPAFLGRRRVSSRGTPSRSPGLDEFDGRTSRTRRPGNLIEGALDGTNKALQTVLGNDAAAARPFGTGAIDLEAQGDSSGAKSRVDAIGDLIYGSYDTALEDMTADERDKLVNYAFRHKALRAVRPCVWVPRDALGIADDEVRRTQRLSAEYVWISNERARVDAKGNVRFGGAPPDQSPVDMIQL